MSVPEVSRRPRVVLGTCLLAAPAAIWIGSHQTRGTTPCWAAVGLVLLTAGIFVVLFAPGLGFAALVLRRFEVGGLAARVTLAVGASGGITWLGWWVWVASPVAGRVVSVLVYAALAAALVTSPPPVLRQVARAAVVLSVAATFSLACVGLLALHGGLNRPTRNAEQSMFGTADDMFPHEWIVRVENRSDLRTPALGGWPLADRPPVQSGWIIGAYELSADRDLGYLVSSAMLQSLAIVGVVLVLGAVGLRRRRLLAATALVGVTLFAFANTVFVWPKLLPAGLLLLAVAVLFESGQEISYAGWAAIGAVIAESALAHPGGLVALPALVVVVVRVGLGRDWWRKLGMATVTLAVLAVPWLAYREFYDHSTSELLKLHLAGIDTPDSRSLTQAMIDQYRRLGLEGALRHRVENLQELVNLSRVMRVFEAPSLSAAREKVVELDGFVPLWAGGVLLLVSPVLLLRRRLNRDIYTLFWAGLAALLSWTMVEFGSVGLQAFTHNAPYAAILLVPMAVAAAAAMALPRWAVTALVAVQAALTVWVIYPMGAATSCGSGMCSPYRGAPTARPGALIIPLAVVSVFGAAACAAVVFGLRPSAARHASDDTGTAVATPDTPGTPDQPGSLDQPDPAGTSGGAPDAVALEPVETDTPDAPHDPSVGTGAVAESARGATVVPG